MLEYVAYADVSCYVSTSKVQSMHVRLLHSTLTTGMA